MIGTTQKQKKAKCDIEQNPTGIKGIFKKIMGMREMNLILIIIAFGVFLTTTTPYFATWLNIKVLLSGLSTDALLVIAMTIVLISGGIDLSIGSVMCLTMAVSATMFRGGMNPWLASIVGIIAAIIVGWVQGMLITKIKLSHFIVTLCFMGIARGLVLTISNGTPISLVAPLAATPVFKTIGQGNIFGFIPMQVIIFLILAVISDFMTRKSAPMRQVFYTGSNEKAAAYSGIMVDRVKIAAMMISGLFAGIAGVIYMVKFSGVPMSAGSGAEMTAISSAVIGGCSMNGGRGTIFGAILGLVLMSMVTNAMNLFAVSPTLQDLIRYLILLLAVILDNLQQNALVKRTS